MSKAELVFIPAPGMGHLVSAVEIAKLLIHREERLFITVIIIELPFDSTLNSYTESLSPTQHIQFVHLPPVNDSKPPGNFRLTDFIDNQKTRVKEAVAQITESVSSPRRLAGFVVDMFCTCMMDVANEFGVPSYLFFTSGAAFLGLLFHLQTLQDEQKADLSELKDSTTELTVPIPSFASQVPVKLIPRGVLDGPAFLAQVKRFREAKGIIINTFVELESHAIESFSHVTTPQIFPLGPILNLKGGGETQQRTDIMAWLDDQPPSSIVFLCFGSMGGFRVDQVKEIAHGLERSGHRFLWSLRQSPPEDHFSFPTDYTNLEEVLPNGFLDRTSKIGKVIGWAPQVAILAHQAIGGFVSHCGWNSTLESIWFGVPIAAWPMYAEQQMNAFELVKELGLAVEIKMDYRKSESQIVSADVVERGIRHLMERDSEVRKKAKEMKDDSRKAMRVRGSSYTWLDNLIEHVLDNII